ncbi:hypothetical protein JK358_07960 [Nocardia sp. 2]|uniref:DUF4034 domain-containing protein n=1 Tax=Nocardia acididurans TaxID=2802282 RepID=A0ABS1M1A3_9NOCA|nr:hypothetical protein [Nocardia acididurans]MBL1074330.1 hypothetical protein [Nocardia acididurans]
MEPEQATGRAAARIATARSDPAQRLQLAAEFYPARLDAYGRAESTFLRWVIHRGVLHPDSGSAWWRAVNDRLLQDKLEARLLWDAGIADAHGPGTRAWLDFLHRPGAATWYRAHNRSVVTGYLDNPGLAESESAPERFMMNVTLARVLFTQALIERPPLALGRLAWLGRRIADPRGYAVGMFLDLRDVFPPRYPLRDTQIRQLLDGEGPVARIIDYGLILPKLGALYDFAAERLDEPRLPDLVADGTFNYGNPSVGRDELTPNALSRMVAALTAPRR